MRGFSGVGFLVIGLLVRCVDGREERRWKRRGKMEGKERERERER